MSNVLEVRGLRKEYKAFTLGDISFDIPKGYILGLVGPNGSGKTTTIRALMRMIDPDAGSIKIFGKSYADDEKDIKNRIGYVGDEQYFYENKRVSWTGRFVSRYFRRWDEGTFKTLLDEFGIDPAMKIGKLSRGMKVKLSIAIALSHDPELLLLDEPTAGLDPVIRREILGKLMKFRGDEERSILISSHITDDIVRIADMVAFLVKGKIVINTDKDEILANWKRIHFRKGALDDSVLAKLTNIEGHAFGSSGITGCFTEIEESIAPAAGTGDVRVENVSLDDVLIAFVKGE